MSRSPPAIQFDGSPGAGRLGVAVMHLGGRLPGGSRAVSAGPAPGEGGHWQRRKGPREMHPSSVLIFESDLSVSTPDLDLCRDGAQIPASYNSPSFHLLASPCVPTYSRCPPVSSLPPSNPPLSHTLGCTTGHLLNLVCQDSNTKSSPHAPPPPPLGSRLARAPCAHCGCSSDPRKDPEQTVDHRRARFVQC